MSLGLILTVILLGGWVFSRLFIKLKLPNILGMVIFGILLGAVIRPYIPETLNTVEPLLKSMALIVILLRAGLGLSRAVLKKAGLTALLMTFVPCFMEGGALMLMFHWVFDFSWAVSGLTAFMLAAVSPAVIVPSMLDLKEKGYGMDKGVPTIILAGASADDIFAITIFTVFLGLSVTGSAHMGKALAHIPLSVVYGLVPGIVLGFFLVRFFTKNYETIRATEKTLLLLTCTVLLVQFGDWISSASLLGVMAVGYILLNKTEDVSHELSLKLKKIWIFAEIILFVLIGLAVDVPTALHAGLKGLGVILVGLVFRSLGVLIATAPSQMNWKERVFCMIAYLPKATVQAALGSVALQNGLAEGNTILALAVLSILFTAPLGLLGINLSYKKLLSHPEE